MQVSFSYLPDATIHDLDAPERSTKPCIQSEHPFRLACQRERRGKGNVEKQVTSARENNMSFQYPTAQPPPYTSYTPIPPMQPIATAPAPNACLIPDYNMPKMPVAPPVGWSPPSTIYQHGLEYLMALDYLFVMQKVELLEAFTGFETKNKYSVVNVRGEPVFYVAEESSCCARCCLGKARPCELAVFDNTRKEILRMVRHFRCDSCCCPCCLQELEVYSGDTLLGSVTQDWSLWQPSFSVRDASGEIVLSIRGPWVKCCVNVSFKVRSADGEHKVGEIKKQWNGLGTELFTDADHFGISFPLDLDVKIKAVLLGACLLIDFMYFEAKHANETAAECAGLVALMECLR